MTRGFVPDRVGDGILAIGEARDRLREREGCSLRIGEERRVTPRRDDQPDGSRREIRGAANWAKGAIAFSRVVRAAAPALVDGSVGLVLAAEGRLFRALRFTFENGKIAGVDIVADRARLDALELGVVAS